MVNIYKSFGKLARGFTEDHSFVHNDQNLLLLSVLRLTESPVSMQLANGDQCKVFSCFM